MGIQRAYCYEDIARAVFKTIPFTGEWAEHFGQPQLGNSSWLFMGDSGHGKTSYTLQAIKAITEHQKVHYNTLEEGMKKSFQMALERENIKAIAAKFQYQQERMPDMVARLSRKRQPKVVVIDSVQYFFRGMQARHYFEFIEQFKDTTFIWLSGVEGNKPKGKVAEEIYYDCDIRVHIKDFEATVEKNRFEAYKPHIIYQQGYEERQLKLLKKG